MAVMNALDRPPSFLCSHSVPEDIMVNQVAKPSQSSSHRNRKIDSRHQRSENAASTKAADANDLPIDVSVTPLHSDDQSLLPSPSVKPVNKDHFEGHIVEQDDSSVHGALVELQRLRVSFASRRLLRVPGPSADTSSVGKENQENCPPGMARRPFGALLDSLRQMNVELGAGRSRSVLPPGSPTTFQLLRLPPSGGNDFSIKLPSIGLSPRSAWGSVDIRPPPANYQSLLAVSENTTRDHGSGRMQFSENGFPLLHMSKNYFPSRDTEFSNGVPFPMLQMIDPRNRRLPFFIPPEDIISHNNNNRETLTTRSGLPIARSEPQTGRSDIAASSQQSIDLLRLQSAVSEADSVAETDSRQV